MSSFTILLFSLSLLFLFTHPTFSQTTTCKSIKFSSKKAFDNCNDLPTLNAVLHWSYSNSSLSVAFTATPPQPDGWVAWGLNPKSDGMVGAQTILAHKPNSTGPVTVDTYDLQSYSNIVKGPISYKVSSLSAEETSGAITIFATWAIPAGDSKLNQVWQVGPVVDGKVGKHDFTPANLGSKSVLSLAASGPSGAPEASPLSPSAGKIEASAPAPAPGGGANAGERLVSGVLALAAIVVSFLF